MSKSLPAVGRDDKGLVRFASRQDRPDTLSTIPRHWLKPQLAMVTSLDFAADTLAGAGGQVCCVWSMETDVLLRRIVAPAPIRCIALSRDAKYLAIGAGAIVSVYRLDNGNLSFEYPHPEIVCSVHFAAAAPLLASASTDGSVQVHHLRNGTMAMRAMHRIGGSVVFLENHGRFVVSESSVDMQFIDTGSGQVTRTFSHHDEPIAPGPLGCMGKMLIAYSGEAVHLFDTARSENACFKVIEYRSTVTSVDISPNQSLFLVTTVDGSVNFYNMGDGTWVAQLESFTNPLWGAKFCGNNTIFAAGGEALIMKIHDGRHVQSYCEAPPIVAGALSPERNTLLVSDRVGGVTCYNLTSGKRSNPFTPHSGSVSVVTGNADYVVSGAYDGICRLSRWDGSEVATFDLGNGPVMALALDSEKASLWVGAYSGAIGCFDLTTRKQIAGWVDHREPVRSLNFDKSFGLLVSGYDDGTWHLRDINAGGKLVRRMRQAGAIYRAIFDEDGSVLTTSDAGVRRFNLFEDRQTLLYEGECIRWFCRLDNGQLCTLGLAGDIRIFDVDTAACLHHTPLQDPRPHRVVLAIGPDRIITGGGDGVIRILDYRLNLLAQSHHLPRGFLWTTSHSDDHPGWLHTNREDLLDVGDGKGDVAVAWPPHEPRRSAHLAVYNSASHVMQVVNGQSAETQTGKHSLTAFPWARQLSYQGDATNARTTG